MPDRSALSPSDVSGKLDMLVELLRDAERLAKELDDARIGDWYRRPDLTAEAAASIGIRAQAPYRQLPEVAAPQGTDDQPAWGFGAIVSGVRG